MNIILILNQKNSTVLVTRKKIILAKIRTVTIDGIVRDLYSDAGYNLLCPFATHLIAVDFFSKY